MSAYLEELLKERPYYSDLFTMAVDPGPRINPDMLVTLRVPGNSHATMCLQYRRSRSTGRSPCASRSWRPSASSSGMNGST